MERPNTEIELVPELADFDAALKTAVMIAQGLDMTEYLQNQLRLRMEAFHVGIDGILIKKVGPGDELDQIDHLNINFAEIRTLIPGKKEVLASLMCFDSHCDITYENFETLVASEVFRFCYTAASIKNRKQFKEFAQSWSHHVKESDNEEASNYLQDLESFFTQVNYMLIHESVNIDDVVQKIIKVVRPFILNPLWKYTAVTPMKDLSTHRKSRWDNLYDSIDWSRFPNFDVGEVEIKKITENRKFNKQNNNINIESPLTRILLHTYFETLTAEEREKNLMPGFIKFEDAVRRVLFDHYKSENDPTHLAHLFSEGFRYKFANYSGVGPNSVKLLERVRESLYQKVKM